MTPSPPRHTRKSTRSARLWGWVCGCVGRGGRGRQAGSGGQGVCV
jgi:hypothetical protein